jgi:hypothetical protein
MFAAQNGHIDTVNALAGTHNANVEAVDRWGKTAMMFAAELGHTDTVNALAGTYNANVWMLLMRRVIGHGVDALPPSKATPTPWPSQARTMPHRHRERTRRHAQRQCGCC